MAESGSRSPHPFPLTVLVGDNTERILMVATKKIFFFCYSGQRAAGNMIPFSVILYYSVCMIHLKFYTVLIWELPFFYLEKDKACKYLLLSLLTIYLVLRLPNRTISPILIPFPLSHVRLSQVSQFHYRTIWAPLPWLRHNLLRPGYLRTVPLWNSSPWPVLPWFC